MAHDDEQTDVTIRAGDREVHTTLEGLQRAGQRALGIGASEPEGHQLSDEVRTIALAVIGSDPRFAHVSRFRMGYALVWGKEPEGRGGIHVLAKAQKAPALWADLGEYDAVIVANEKAWRHLTTGQRTALVAHELCHIGENNDGRLTMLEHDIEEFAWIARRYGQWHSGLEHFAEQLGLGLSEQAEP